jgi:hypothetical protein
MSNPLTRRLLVVLAILVLVVVSTAASAHGHLDANSNESHCPLCIAVHRAKHAIATVGITLCFMAVEAVCLVPSKSLAVPFIQPRLAQGRAPPKL